MFTVGGMAESAGAYAATVAAAAAATALPPESNYPGSDRDAHVGDHSRRAGNRWSVLSADESMLARSVKCWEIQPGGSLCGGCVRRACPPCVATADGGVKAGWLLLVISRSNSVCEHELS